MLENQSIYNLTHIFALSNLVLETYQEKYAYDSFKKKYI